MAKALQAYERKAWPAGIRPPHTKPQGTITLNNESTTGGDGLQGQQYAVFPAYRGGTGSDDNAGMGISVGTNGISVYEHAGNYLPPLLTWANDGSITGWIHIAVVYNNKAISLYVNGALVRNGQTSPKTNVYPGYSIGNGYNYGAYVGGMSDMRIWGTARNAAQVMYDMQTEVAPNSLGLQGDWTFGGSNQPLATVNDETGNGHPITLPQIGCTTQQTVPPNIASAPLNNTVAALVQSLHLDGSERNTSALNAVPVTNTFTMELWAKPQGTITLNTESTTGGDGLYGQQYAVFPSYRAGTNDDNKSGMGISVGTNGVSVYEHSAAELAPLLTWAVTINGWTHIAVVYNNGTPSLYINGTLVHTGIQSQKTVSPSYNIGEGSAYYGPYTGNLSELHIWGTALGATQIQADMVTEVSPTQPGLLADWTFDGSNQPGSQVTDLTGNQYTITLPQAGTSGQNDVPPVSGMPTGGGTGGGSTTTASTGQGRYRYGFNGKENDNEVKGVGDQQDYGFRIYDPRVGRFLSVDPLSPKYPELTPYQFASNSPIANIDEDGLEAAPASANNKQLNAANDIVSKNYDPNHNRKDISQQLMSAVLQYARSDQGKAQMKTAGDLQDFVTLVNTVWKETAFSDMLGQKGNAFRRLINSGKTPEQRTDAIIKRSASMESEMTKTNLIAMGLTDFYLGAMASSLPSLNSRSSRDINISSPETEGRPFTTDDVLSNPKMIDGKSLNEVQTQLSNTKGWENDVMRRSTTNPNGGWVLRELNEAGKEYTGRMIQYHPGTSRHFGSRPYWKVSSGSGTVRYPAGK